MTNMTKEERETCLLRHKLIQAIAFIDLAVSKIHEVDIISDSERGKSAILSLHAATDKIIKLKNGI